MSFTDNFGNPKGLLGRMMLVSMDREHLPMAQWALEQIKIPENGKVADLGCGGGYNIKRMLEMSPKAKFIGLDISDESVKKAQKVNNEYLALEAMFSEMCNGNGDIIKDAESISAFGIRMMEAAAQINDAFWVQG